ncbi:hypothetical protein V8E55_007332 [Tylopilus felleus]
MGWDTFERIPVLRRVYHIVIFKLSVFVVGKISSVIPIHEQCQYWWAGPYECLLVSLLPIPPSPPPPLSLPPSPSPLSSSSPPSPLLSFFHPPHHHPPPQHSLSLSHHSLASPITSQNPLSLLHHFPALPSTPQSGPY